MRDTRPCVAYGCTAPGEEVAVSVWLCPVHRAAVAAVLVPPQPPSTAVVYYAWTPEERPRVGGLVKIGYSASVHKRMSSLGCDLLATEPGDRRLESTRHRQFAHLRVEREYFTPGHLLWQHVEQLAGHQIEQLPTRQ
jgi:hypothetical protein